MRMGWTEILIVLAVILVFFGGKRLPELGRALGKSLRGFKEGVEGKGGDEQGGQPSSGSGGPMADGAPQAPGQRLPPPETPSGGNPDSADADHPSGSGVAKGA